MCKKTIYVVCSICMFISFATARADLVEWEAAISAGDPLHWYKFDETSGTDCPDSGSGGLDGTYDGVQLAEEGFFAPGTAAGFDRSASNRVDFAGATDLAGPWTVEYIVKTTKAPAANDSQALHDGVDTSIRLAGWTSLGEAGFTQYGVADYQFTPSAGLTLNDLVLAQDEWMHLVFRNDGAGTQLFLNGELVGTSTDSVDLPRLRIGAHGAGPADMLQGVLDEAVVFDRALMDVEIEDHYAAAVGIGARVKAAGPSPADGTMIGQTRVTLAWQPGGSAATHALYLGASLEEVDQAGPEDDAFQGSQAETTFEATALTPGATYYWRVDEVNDVEPNSPWKGDVWSFWVQPVKAWNPTPPDSVNYVRLDQDLTWDTGIGTLFHTVYFGESFDEVNDAVAGGWMIVPASYDPDLQEADKTYYWRVDEFAPTGTHKGDVWSFTTVPEIAVTDPDLAGWWTFDEGDGITAVDWSGHGNHGSFVGDPQWIDGYERGALELGGRDSVDCGEAPGLAITEALTIACWVNPAVLSGDRGWVGRDGAYALKSNADHVRLTTPGILDHDGLSTILAVGAWQHVAITFQPEQIGGMVFYLNGVETERMDSSALDAGTGPFQIGNNQWNQLYVGLIDDARVYSKVLTEEEIQQVMRGNPLLATNPEPDRNAVVDIREAGFLRWTPGDTAASHDVYLGTDRGAVVSAGPDAAEYQGNQAATSLSLAGRVEFGGGDYYWRIDEVEADGTVHTGGIWKFTVPDYLVVEDFDRYSDDMENEMAIFQTWIDGWENNTGSTVGYFEAIGGTFGERTIVHGGTQSMPFDYNNVNAPYYSETERTWNVPQDWTVEGAGVLTLYVRGQTTNDATGPFYVALEDSAGNLAVVPLDPAVLATTRWAELNVPLSDFNGVNAAAVKKMYIGVGDRDNPLPDGAGLIYIDDIGATKPTPVE